MISPASNAKKLQIFQAPHLLLKALELALVGR